MTETFDINTWRLIAADETSGDQVVEIIESWQTDRNDLLHTIERLKQEINVEWIKGYNAGYREGLADRNKESEK